MFLAKGATSARSRPRVPGSLSLKQCYERMDQALEFQREEGYTYIERGEGIEEEKMELYRKMCRAFTEVWFAADLLEDRLHALTKSAKASLTAPLFLSLLAFIQAVALHRLANFAAILSEVDIVLKPSNRYPTSFVTKEPKFDLDGTKDSQDFLEAAMLYYEAAASEFQLFKNGDPTPDIYDMECFDLLFSTGQIQCRCQMNLRNRRFNSSELSEVARNYTESFFGSVKSFVESVPALMEDLPSLRRVFPGLNFFSLEDYYTLFHSILSTISEITRHVEYKYQSETDKDYSYPHAVFTSVQPIIDQLSHCGRVTYHRESTSAKVALAHFKISEQSVEQNHRRSDRALDVEEHSQQDFRKEQHGAGVKDLPDVQEVRDSKELREKGEIRSSFHLNFLGGAKLIICCIHIAIELHKRLIEHEQMQCQPCDESLLPLHIDVRFGGLY